MSDMIATRDAYGKALLQLGRENPNIVVLDADLTNSTKTELFARAFPQRFFNLGIAEQDLMATASGLAGEGKIVFASSFACFASRGWEHARVTLAFGKRNVKIVATHGGISVGEDGAVAQMNEDIAIWRALPNMTVIVPADAVETEKAVRAAAALEGPVYIRLGRPKVPVICDENYDFKLGRANLLREGADVAIFACGIMVAHSLEAAERLEERGISAAVLNMATVKPLDAETLTQWAERTRAVVTAEEHSIIGGLGSAVAEVLAEKLPTPMERVGIKDCFGESGTSEELFHKYGLTAEHVAAACQRVVAKSKATRPSQA